MSELSASTQDYVKAVWVLGEWSDAPVMPKLMSDRMGLKLSTVSDAVRKLTAQGLVDHARYGAVTLTDAGRAHAVAMVRRHRLIETFLIETLGYGLDQVHDEAEALEHSVSDFMIDRMADYLGHPERDPHGDPIPSADGTATRPDAQLLTSAKPGQRVQVARLSDEDPRLLQFFTAHGIGYGTLLEVRPAAPYTDAVEVIVGDAIAPLTLGRSASDAIWVESVA